MKITLTGTKEDLIAYLADAQSAHREVAKAVKGEPRARAEGKIAGLEEAITALSQWDGAGEPRTTMAAAGGSGGGSSQAPATGGAGNSYPPT